jgi:hypothetical protein
VVNGPIIKKFLEDDLLDGLFLNLLARILYGDLLSVLWGDDDGVDTQRVSSAAVLFVMDCDLGLRVGAERRQEARAMRRSQCCVELVSEHDGERHVPRRLIGSIAKGRHVEMPHPIYIRAVSNTLLATICSILQIHIG